MMKKTNFVLYRCYAAGRPRPMREDFIESIVSTQAWQYSEDDPEGEYQVRGVVLHEEGREETLETWIGGKLQPIYV